MLCTLKVSAHCSHRSAIRIHVALLAGSRVNLAICSQSAACRRNSSDGFMYFLLDSLLVTKPKRRGRAGGAGGRVRMSDAVAKLLRVLGKSQPAQGELTPSHSVVVVGRLLRQREAFTGALLIG